MDRFMWKRDVHGVDAREKQFGDSEKKCIEYLRSHHCELSTLRLKHTQCGSYMVGLNSHKTSPKPGRVYVCTHEPMNRFDRFAMAVHLVPLPHDESKNETESADLKYPTERIGYVPRFLASTMHQTLSSCKNGSVVLCVCKRVYTTRNGKPRCDCDYFMYEVIEPEQIPISHNTAVNDDCENDDENDDENDNENDDENNDEGFRDVPIY